MRIKIMVSHSVYGYYELKCDSTTLTCNSRKDGAIFDNRITLDGEIKVSGDNYDKLLTHANRLLSFTYFEDSVLIGTGTIDLFNKRNIFPRVCFLKLTIEDKYTLFDKYSDTKYNICQVGRASGTLFWETYYDVIYYSTGTVVHYQVFSNLTDFPTWQTEFSYPIIDAYRPNAGYGWYFVKCVSIGNGNYAWDSFFAALRGYGTYIDGVATAPTSGTWTYQFDETINGQLVPVFYTPIPEVNFLRSVNPGEGNGSIQLENQFLEDNYHFTTEIRDLQEVLKFVINKIDNSILFDSNSFLYLDTYAGENISNSFLHDINPAYPVYSSQYSFKDMVIMPLSDCISAFTPGSTWYPSTIAMLNWNTIWKFFEDRGFYWFLELSFGDYYFRLKHYTEISQTDQSLLLLNYRTVENIEYLQPQYFKITNSNSGSGIDFTGFPTEFTNINSTQTKDTNSSQIHVDIDDIAGQGVNAYSDSDNEQFVILCTDYDSVTPVRYLRTPAGLITAKPKHNSELGFPFVQKNQFAPVPDVSAKINGLTTTISTNRRVKDKQIKLEIPHTIIDFQKNLFIFGRSNEIISESHKTVGYKSELTIKS